MKFENDPIKAASNIKDHGVTFQEAESAFDDPYGFVEEQTHRNETRFALIAMNRAFRLLKVIYVYPIEANSIRIISAFVPDRTDRKKYEKNRRAR